MAVADTVGCGDSFAAGIVLGYVQKQPLPSVLALSNAVGAATATSPGAGRNVASAETVRELLYRQASSSSGGFCVMLSMLRGPINGELEGRCTAASLYPYYIAIQCKLILILRPAY